MKRQNIRNISVIAHIDHGKSTLADRIIDECNAISERDKKSQLLDNMDLERERGITIKLNTVTLTYEKDKEKYEINLIDTPGHVDFSYEVSRSLAASDGALLLIDAAQGVQAQTLANLLLALDNDLTIIPVINKIDLPNADPESCIEELNELFGFEREEIMLTSAKTGEGVKALMDEIVRKIPAPKGDENKPLKALIFDSYYDAYLGVIVALRIFDGTIKRGDMIKFMKKDTSYEVLSLYNKTPFVNEQDTFRAGDVCFMSASIKKINDVAVGDTVTTLKNGATEALHGYKKVMPMVYSGIYPIDSSRFEDLREALEKLALNDASLAFEPETSSALGFGFRCGFLGLLHMDVISERIRREFNIDIISTAPSVIYKVLMTNGEIKEVASPADMPEATKISHIEEPYIKANILSPDTYIGPIMELCESKRGNFITMDYLDKKRVSIIYEMPLLEIVFDFFDKLKSGTKGYASFDYELDGYKKSDLVKVDVLINGEKVDALAMIVHRDFAYNRAKKICENLKEVIPRAQFEIPIQAAIGYKIIARTTIKALRKDVLAKCYGGDVTRKKKLLEKQKEGKKRMKDIGSVSLPQEAFMEILKTD